MLYFKNKYFNNKTKPKHKRQRKKEDYFSVILFSVFVKGQHLLSFLGQMVF